MYFVPAPENVYCSVCPLPSGHRAGIGRVVPPSSDHTYVHGPSGQVELVALKLTTCPATGEAGLKVKLAMGGVGSTGGVGVIGGVVGSMIGAVGVKGGVGSTGETGSSGDTGSTGIVGVLPRLW
jgi:hypothetical protein